MRIDIRMESGKRIILPIPNGWVRLLGPKLLRHADIGEWSAEQCLGLVDGLLRHRKVLHDEPLVCVESVRKWRKVTVWL